MGFVTAIPERKQQPISQMSLQNIRHKIHGPLISHTVMQSKQQMGTYARDFISSSQPVVTKKQRVFGNGSLLKKGQKILIPDVTSLQVCAGWDVKRSDVDIDISAFMLGASHNVLSDDWFVFYNKPNSPDGSMILDVTGNQTDDRVIAIQLQRIHQNVQRIVFVLTIDEAMNRSQNFSMVEHAYIRLLSGKQEFYRFELTEYYTTVTSMMLGELYRYNGKWKFNPIGDGVKKDLEGLCTMYGVRTA